MAIEGDGREKAVTVVVVGDTSATYAAACTTSQVCRYADILAPTALDTQLANTGEVKVAVSAVPATATPCTDMTHAECVAAGRSLQPTHHEGITVQCTNTNQLRFASETASTVVKIIAVK